MQPCRGRIERRAQRPSDARGRRGSCRAPLRSTSAASSTTAGPSGRRARSARRRRPGWSRTCRPRGRSGGRPTPTSSSRSACSWHHPRVGKHAREGGVAAVAAAAHVVDVLHRVVRVALRLAHPPLPAARRLKSAPMSPPLSVSVSSQFETRSSSCVQWCAGSPGVDAARHPDRAARPPAVARHHRRDPRRRLVARNPADHRRAGRLDDHLARRGRREADEAGVVGRHLAVREGTRAGRRTAAHQQWLGAAAATDDCVERRVARAAVEALAASWPVVFLDIRSSPGSVGVWSAAFSRAKVSDPRSSQRRPDFTAALDHNRNRGAPQLQCSSATTSAQSRRGGGRLDGNAAAAARERASGRRRRRERPICRLMAREDAVHADSRRARRRSR